jgi:hypothetical protein
VQNSLSADEVLMSLEKRRANSVGSGDSTQNSTTKNGYQLLEVFLWVSVGRNVIKSKSTFRGRGAAEAQRLSD